MKLNMVFALAAVLAVSPIAECVAADAPAADAAESTGPTPAQLKARKAKKPFYMKIAEGKAAAEKCDQPHVIAILPIGNKAVVEFDQKVIKHKAFMKDFAPKNCVFTYIRVKQNSKNPKSIDTRSMKEPELKFLENFAVSAHDIALAKAQKLDEPKYTDFRIYPKILVLDSSSSNELFKLPKFDKEGGFGVWLCQVVDLFRAKGIEPELSPYVTNIIENPDDTKKWK